MLKFEGGILLLGGFLEFCRNRGMDFTRRWEFTRVITVIMYMQRHPFRVTMVTRTHNKSDYKLSGPRGVYPTIEYAPVTLPDKANVIIFCCI